MRYCVLILVILVLGFVSAQGSFCIDFDAPSSVDLDYSRSGNNINLYWSESIDSPECSGIDYYSVYKNGVSIANVSDLVYIDSIGADASYYVIAVDLVGHESVSNVLEVLYSSSPSSGGSSGGGGGSSSGSASGNTSVPVFLGSGSDESSGNEDELELGLESDSGEGFFGFLTGAVTGLTSVRGLVGVGVFLLIILGAVLVVYNKKKIGSKGVGKKVGK